MTVPENPFFTRELRQFRRRREAARWWVACTLGYMLLMVFMAIAWLVYPETAPTAPGQWEVVAFVWMLVVPHAVLCLAAAVYGAERIFSAEYKASTLQEVLTLPYSSTMWLVLKHHFPLALLLAAWAVGLPFYFFYGAIKVAGWSTMLSLAPVSLALGLGWLLLSPLFPPDFLLRWQHDEVAAPPARTGDARKREFQADEWVRTAMAFSAVMMVASLWIQGISWWLEWRPFYTTMVPAGFLWLTVAASLLWAWAQSLAAAVEGSEAGAARAQLFRWSAVFFAYYAVLGLNWLGLPAARQWLWLAGFPTVLFVLRLVERRRHPLVREDRLTPRELAWVRRRWDDAVLIKDLRTHCRAYSLRRAAVQSLAGVLFVAGLFGLAYYRYGFRPFGGGSPGWLVYSYLTGLIGAPGRLMAAQWVKERKSSSLTLLLISPLSSREIIVGRLRAAMLYGWLAEQFGVLLVFVAVFTGLAWTRPYLVPALLALLPIAVSSTIVFGLSYSAGTQSASPTSIVTAAVFQCALLVAGVVLCFTGAGMSPPMVWVLACLTGWLNGWLCHFFFHAKIRELDNLRRGDMLMEEPTPKPTRRDDGLNLGRRNGRPRGPFTAVPPGSSTAHPVRRRRTL